MPAMTMRFPVRTPDVLAGITPGMRVRFELEREGERLVLTRVMAATPESRGRPGLHDHTPHHGGVVTMVGLRHLEAVAESGGRVRVYLTDVWRRPLSPAGWTGSVTLDLPSGKRTLDLSVGDDVLEAEGPPLDGVAVLAHVRVAHGGEGDLEMHSMLPLHPGVIGTPAAPVDGCRPPVARPGERLPRCTLTFPGAVTSVAVVPDTALLVVAVAGGGVSAWRLPGGEFALGFAAPPAVTGSPDGAPHPEAVDAVAVSPDGRELAIASEGRLLRYAVATGRLLRILPAPGAVTHGLAWSPDGRLLLVTSAYDRSARLLRADDGEPIRQLDARRECIAAAFSADGRHVVVGSESGEILLYDLVAETDARAVADVGPPLHAVALVGDRLIAAGSGGSIQIVDVTTGSPVARHVGGSPCYRLTASPQSRLLACAGYDGSIRVYDLKTGAFLEALRWHGGSILGLAWAGTTLVSGDANGSLALWDVPAP
jgi:hypothetical protein